MQCPQILADQLTLYQPGGADYVHHITTGTPRISDLSTDLDSGGLGVPEHPRNLGVQKKGQKAR